jgi:hypothetical protein
MRPISRRCLHIERGLYPSRYQPQDPVNPIVHDPPDPIDTFLAGCQAVPKNCSDTALATAYEASDSFGADCSGSGLTVPQGADCHLYPGGTSLWNFATGLGSYRADTLVGDLAKIDTSPATGPPGTAVQITGTQFMPGEPVTFTDDSTRGVLCRKVIAASDGSVSCDGRIASSARLRIVRRNVENLEPL